MYIYVYTYTYVYLYTQIYLFICIYIYTNIFIYMYIFIYIYMLYLYVVFYFMCGQKYLATAQTEPIPRLGFSIDSSSLWAATLVSPWSVVAKVSKAWSLEPQGSSARKPSSTRKYHQPKSMETKMPSNMIQPWSKKYGDFVYSKLGVHSGQRFVCGTWR